MDQRIENYKSFFTDQVKEAIDEQKKMNHSTMGQLFKTDALSLLDMLNEFNRNSAQLLSNFREEWPRD